MTGSVGGQHFGFLALRRLWILFILVKIFEIFLEWQVLYLTLPREGKIDFFGNNAFIIQKL